MEPTFQENWDRHRLYHGTVKAGEELDIPVNARRRSVSPACSTNPRAFTSPAISTNTPREDVTSRTKDDLRNASATCHWCQLAKFKNYDASPITVVNHVDNTALPSNFRFIEESELGLGVERADEDFRSGCQCRTDVECERKACSCLQDMERLNEEPGSRAKINAYVSQGGYKDCLRPVILQTRDPIYECHSKCKCSINCNNRVVERGRKVPLEIFRTVDGRGWGVRAKIDLNTGQYIDKYVGEIITGAEAQSRRDTSAFSQQKDVYLFALDKFTDELSMDPRLAGSPYEVDGEFISGPTRFINHSCNPNMRTFARVGDHADKHIHDLALFAIRNIPAGEELTFDYIDAADDLEEKTEDFNDPEMQRQMMVCLCGARNCRGYLW